MNNGQPVYLADTPPNYYSNARLEAARQNPKLETLLNVLEFLLFNINRSRTFEQKVVLKTFQETMEFLLPRWNSTYRIAQLRDHLNQPDNKFSAQGGRMNWLLKYLQMRWDVILKVEESVFPKLNWISMTTIIFDIIIVKDLAVQKKWWTQPNITQFYDFSASYLMKHSTLFLGNTSWIDYIDHAELLKNKLTESEKQEFPLFRFLVLSGIILYVINRKQ